MSKETKIIIRKAVEGDYSAINSLYQSTYNFYCENIPNDYKRPPRTTLPRGTFLNQIEKDDELMLVAEDKGLVVGVLYAIIEKYDGDEWTQPYTRVSIEEISVSKEARRKKIGFELMQAVENWAKEKNIHDLTALVFDFNKSAISFYENLNYRPYSIQMKKKILS